MSRMDSSHYRTVEKTLSGERAVDEQTFASLAILSEKLERLKELDEAFSGVEFSPDVKKLRSQKNTVAVS